jgi:HEAT repeat protein
VRPTRGSLKVDFGAWDYYWAFHRAGFDQVPRGPDVSGNNPLFGLGGRTPAGGVDKSAAAIGTHAHPTLKAVLGDAQQADWRLVGSACIAFAKVVREPTEFEVLYARLDRQSEERRAVRAKAALALGCLRREQSTERFSGSELDRVRERLFQALEAKDEATEVREAAAIALGLLADQPRSESRGPGAMGTRLDTGSRLFRLIRDAETDSPVRVGLLIAATMLPARDATAAQRHILRTLAGKGLYGETKARAVERAYAAHALGNLGDVRDIGLLAELAKRTRDSSDMLRRTSAFALGRLGARLAAGPGTTGHVVALRVDSQLAGILDASREDKVSNAAAVSMAQVAAAEARAERPGLLTKGEVVGRLIAIAKKRKGNRQGYGALGLGLLAAAISPETGEAELGRVRGTILEALREGFGDERAAPMTRAAFAVALGLAADGRSARDLLAVVADKRAAGKLRAYAAEALGRIGRADPRTLRTLRETLVERVDPSLHERAALALGLLRDRGAVPVIQAQLEKTAGIYVREQLVRALARIGDERGLERLAQITAASDASMPVRVQAAYGLGWLGEAGQPTLARFQQAVDYLVPSAGLNLALTSL